METKLPRVEIFTGQTAPRKPPSKDLAFMEGIAEPVALFQQTVNGPYLLQIDGLLKKDGYWVEVEVVLVRYADGRQDFNVIPKANARSYPIPPAETKRRPAASTFTQQQFGNYKQEDLAGTLTAHDAKGGGTLVVTGLHPDDDVADDLAELPEAHGEPAKTRSRGKPKRRTKAKAKTVSRTRTAGPKPAGPAATSSLRKVGKSPPRRTPRPPKQT